MVEDEEEQRQLRRQKWHVKQQRHEATTTTTADNNNTNRITNANNTVKESLKGGSVSVLVSNSDSSIVHPTTAMMGDSNSNSITSPPKPSVRWNKENNDANDGEEDGGGDDLFPTLDEANNTSTTIVTFNEAKSKVGDLFANRTSPPASSPSNDINVINNDPITLPPSASSVTAHIKRKRFMATGLGNLGNTCFMNSTLQCLAHTPPLREYFLSGKFFADLNTDNPLGTGGELAKEFATLLEQMWQIQKKEEGLSNDTVGNHNNGTIYSSSRVYSPGNYDSALSSVTYPRSFKHTLGKHAEQFVGYDQHDSQELAIYLLDALHEDTNRVRKKPYVEKPEQAEDESDDVASAKAWNIHLQRDDSRILENFMGQIKSRLRCPVEGCGRVSTTFDPSMYLSVPIPGSTDRVVKVTFVPLLGGGREPQEGGCAAAAEMSIKLCKNSTVKTLRARVVEMARECYGFDATELCEEDVQFADIFQQNVWSYYGEDYAIDGIKDSDVTYAYQLHPLAKMKEEFKEYQEKLDAEKNKDVSSGSADSSSNAAVSSSSSLSSLLDPATKQELDADPVKWENKLSGNFLVQPSSLYRITNERRCTHKERLAFYGKLLKFIQKCKQCSDAVVTPPTSGGAGDDANSDGDVVMKNEKKNHKRSDSPNSTSSQTLEEVSYSSHQFKGVRTARDLALLEYCASKLLAAIHELKNPLRSNSTHMRNMNENGTVVQIKIKKNDAATNTTGGGFRSNTYGKSSSSSSWKVVGEPIIARIPPTLTVGGLRKMLGRRVSCALKLKDDDPHRNQPSMNNDPRPDACVAAAAPLMSPEMVVKQVALSYSNGKGSNNRYGSNDAQTLGSVTEDQLSNSHGGAARTTHTALFAKSTDKEENELVSSLVENEGAIFVSWPPQFNDIFEEDMLFAKDEFLTEKQKGEQASTPNRENKGVSVMDCIAKYCETEQLDESDMWYCDRCKKHVRAWKQFELYRTPPILIIHLKRFHFSATTHRRDKIDTLIDFPLEDLDLSEIVSHWDDKIGRSQGEKQAPIYDCYAVSNHFGGLGGGHYTAYAKGDDGSWCNFDDSRVTTGVDESEVVSTSAYCLYYKRKDVVFNETGGDEDGDAVMTKEDDNNGASYQGVVPVSPSPCIEEVTGTGESPHHDERGDGNDDTSMEVDNQDDGSAASYTTPTDGMDGDTTSTSSIPHQPITDEKEDVFFDLQ